MLFPPTTLERAMKVKEVILRALSKEYTWLQAAEILASRRADCGEFGSDWRATVIGV